jgi:hypothetical protein
MYIQNDTRRQLGRGDFQQLSKAMMDDSAWFVEPGKALAGLEGFVYVRWRPATHRCLLGGAQVVARTVASA